tara:strand:+ start:343 stop:627 length:285 start_codon:yes stop_codon:yes gene_type:complete
MKKELVDQAAHFLTSFAPLLLILWQPIWFGWLVILFPLSREHYQAKRRMEKNAGSEPKFFDVILSINFIKLDLLFAYIGIICAYLLAFIYIRVM